MLTLKKGTYFSIVLKLCVSKKCSEDGISVINNVHQVQFGIRPYDSVNIFANINLCIYLVKQATSMFFILFYLCNYNNIHFLWRFKLFVLNAF